jgi:pyruvate-ferredoxin/flavodoxin oxidoreductase
VSSARRLTVDANGAVASVAYRLNEVIAIYPITPASPMAESADAWAADGRPNLWGSVPAVVALQSEAGAAGSLHGALQAGALATTFTASQGLLLMIPTLYKLAGELTPVVLHVASRAVATQGLSIFCDHSDVMATRGTGCGLLCAASVQEASDFAAISTALSLRSRLPFLHVFDGFRTSHEIQAIAPLDDGVLRQLIPAAAISAHRGRALTPEHPVIRGTSHNPDVGFQARETVNRFVEAVPDHLLAVLEQFAGLTGRRYRPYDYLGAADAERVLVLMGSACETATETLDRLGAAGERLGLLKLRLFRPLAARLLVEALPAGTRAIAVLDRCKDPGAPGEPLYLDVVTAIAEQWRAVHGDQRPLPRVVGGRYGLASKEFTPAMVKAVFDQLALPEPFNHFSVGIDDDLTHHSLVVDNRFVCEPSLAEAPDEVRAILYGLAADGTVGANKAAIRIIGEATDLQVQGMFVYDSHKAGTVTESHLRFGPRPIRSAYLIQRPTLVACHQWDFVDRLDLLAGIEPRGVLLLNSPYGPAQTWARLPAAMRVRIRALALRVFVIDAQTVARQAGMGSRINTVMLPCFLVLSGVLPREQAIAHLAQFIRTNYAHKGEAVVACNLAALAASLEELQRLDWQAWPAEPEPQSEPRPESGPLQATGAQPPLPPFVQAVTLPMLARRGDQLPVSALPCDGTWPLGTARYEKRNIASEIPVWDSDLCVQCGKCVLVCPHAVIRAKVAAAEALAAAPPGFAVAAARDHAFAGQRFTLQVAAEDCTGCALCVAVCPVSDPTDSSRRAINMAPQRPLRAQARRNWTFFLSLPEVPRAGLNLHKIAQQQLQQPLFEFPGACGGCGETPYLKLASQLFGDRLLIANATGCSSIYGGNLPTTPWCANAEGRGPAWSNSLFEDNAEFGFGMRVALDQRRQTALALLADLPLPAALIEDLIGADQSDEAGIVAQRQRVAALKAQLQQTPQAERLLHHADALVKTSVWLVGGDGWAYDIGFGGLDHVLASGRDLNALVLDTEVYSNTGGQASKATPLGAVARFAAAGKATAKKDLGLMAMTYGDVYVASVAMGARDEHTIRVFLEAESYPGPSLILAYSHCIAHGIAMGDGMTQQQLAVQSGRWLLYRFDPRRRARGLNPLQLDSPAPRLPLAQAMASENRFRQLQHSQPERAAALAAEAQVAVDRRWALYRALATLPVPVP